MYTPFRALVTGATGFIGHRLLSRLERPVVLSRNAARARTALANFHVEAFDWDAERAPPPAEAFADVNVVVHLAGEPVAEGRWTAAKKQRLVESRELGTRHLVQTLAKLDHKPRVLISASAVGYYGSRGDDVLDESASPGDDFLAAICKVWEHESHPAADAGIRVVNPRIGIVLGPGGGALQKMLLPFKLGLGSPLGNGRQWMPWVHIDDLVNLFLFAAQHESLSGPVNATAPHPVSNREFTKTLGRVLRRPTFFPPVPPFALRLMMGEFGKVLLDSQRTTPRAAEGAGFQFDYPDLEPALRNILCGEAKSRPEEAHAVPA